MAEPLSVEVDNVSRLQNLREQIASWGIARTLWAQLMTRSRGWFMLSRVYVLSLKRGALPPDLDRRLSIRLAFREDLIRAVREMPKQLDIDSVEKALARGDLCVAAFNGERMVAFAWGSCTTAPHSDGLRVKVDWPYTYGYKSYVQPEFRGKRLSAALILVRDKVHFERGFQSSVGFVETHNFPSLRINLAMGSRLVGYAGHFRLFQQAYPFRTPGVRAHTFRFYRQNNS